MIATRSSSDLETSQQSSKSLRWKDLQTPRTGRFAAKDDVNGPSYASKRSITAAVSSVADQQQQQQQQLLVRSFLESPRQPQAFTADCPFSVHISYIDGLRPVAGFNAFGGTAAGAKVLSCIFLMV